MRRFWEIENVAMNDKEGMAKEDEKVASTVSRKWVDGRYQVKVLLKVNKVELQNNYTHAVQRLQSTEKRLFKDDKLSRAY